MNIETVGSIVAILGTMVLTSLYGLVSTAIRNSCRHVCG